MSGLIESGFFDEKIKGVKPQLTFLQQPINAKAYEDFKKLTTSVNLITRIKFNGLELMKNENIIGTFIVLGATTKNGMITFPKDILAQYGDNPVSIAVVMYEGESVYGVFLFDFTNITEKCGLFSIFKDLKKTNEYGIRIGKCKNKKFMQYRFGEVLKDYIAVKE